MLPSDSLSGRSFDHNTAALQQPLAATAHPLPENYRPDCLAVIFTHVTCAAQRHQEQETSIYTSVVQKPHTPWETLHPHPSSMRMLEPWSPW